MVEGLAETGDEDEPLWLICSRWPRSTLPQRNTLRLAPLGKSSATACQAQLDQSWGRPPRQPCALPTTSWSTGARWTRWNSFLVPAELICRETYWGSIVWQENTETEDT